MTFVRYVLSWLSRYLVLRSWKRQKNSLLRDVALWGAEVNAQGRMSIDGLDALTLVEQHGSPLLVVNKAQLMRDAQAVLDAFREAPRGSKVLYSYKTNCVPGILREIHGVGIGAEVISPYELWLAEQLGVPGDMIVYNGVGKTEESLRRAIERNILAINIDSMDEIDRIHRVASALRRKANVGIRLGFVPKSQFGLNVASGQAMEACRKVAERSEWLHFQGIHFNVTSNARWASTHLSYVEEAIKFMHEMKSATGLSTSYLDIGGGFGVETTKNMSSIEYGLYRVFDCLPSPPSPGEYQPPSSFLGDVIRAVTTRCDQLGLELPRMIIEPGRLITSKSEMLLARVNAIKPMGGGRKFAMTDAGRLSLTFPCDFEYHEVFVADRPCHDLDSLYHVMGRVCTSADWMFKNRALPELKPGDVLAVMDAGAYFSSYSSNFAFPRPEIVMVSGGKSISIRKSESFEHLTAMDMMDGTRCRRL